MNIAAAIEFGRSSLSNALLSEPLRDAKLLLGSILSKDATFLIAHPEYELTAAELEAFHDAVERRSEHVPIQHITGQQEFYGLEFIVTPDVLIPRPETELLVEHAIAFLSVIENPRFCEIGVGSGCISISVLNAVPTARAIAVDISGPAIDIARQNADIHRVSDRLELRLSDLLAGVSDDELFDAVLSNPPYIPIDEYLVLDREVRGYEPENALTDRGDGLSIVKKIITAAQHKLRPGGVLLLEVGHGQSARVKDMFDSEVWAAPTFFDDLQCIPRTVRVLRR